MVAIDVAEWSDERADLLQFDQRIRDAEDRGPFTLSITGMSTQAARDNAVREIQTRYQRLTPVFNKASSCDAFSHALVRHRALHDLTRPMLRTCYEHGVDTWQWLVRLQSNAGLAAQIAALFHDVGGAHPSAWSVRPFADFAAFKTAQAEQDARLMQAALLNSTVPAAAVAEAMALVRNHESAAPHRALLNDADALSFFNVKSWRYLKHFGPEITQQQVRHSLSRLRPSVRAHLNEARVPPLMQGWLK